MPGGWRVANSVVAADAGSVLGSSTGTAVVSGAGANLNGLWTQLTSSSGMDATGVLVQCCSLTSTASEFSIDIGVGPAGLEQALVSNLILAVRRVNATSVLLPLSIPAGSRLVARAQADVASAATEISLLLFDGDFFSGGTGVMDTYGFVAASTHGTQVDPGTVTSTKGSWSQLSAGLTADTRGIILALDVLGSVSSPTSENVQILVDVGIGPAGSEVVVIPNLQSELLTTAGTAPIIWPAYYQIMDVRVLAGTRLVVRAQSTTGTTGTRLFGAVAYGVRE